MPERPSTLLRTLRGAAVVCGEGVRQGCPLASPLFKLYTEDIFREVNLDAEDHESEYYEGVKIGGMSITDLRYADDVDPHHEALKVYQHYSGGQGCQQTIWSKNKWHGKQSYEDGQNGGAVRYLTVNTEVDGEVLQEIIKFEYLGFCISQDGNCTPEIWRQLAIGMRTLQNVNALWDYGSKLIKLGVLRACICPAATYGCQPSTIKQCDAKYITAFEANATNIFRLSWTQRRTKGSIRNGLGAPED